ncbi:MAG: hypothetical protein KDC27_07300 [Acidobacteria bacterium]|nr:hypothetical protein [Acidobacteriota bacterium]
MFKRLLFGFGIVCAAGLLAALSMTWVIVTVVDEDEGLHLWIPAPVLLAQAAAGIVDPPELHEKLPFEPEQLEAAAAAIRELESAADAELLRIESSDETVVIRKAGTRIEVEVDNRNERVRVHAPLRQVRQFLENRPVGALEPAALFRLARSLPSGPLVEVSEPGQRVAIRIW